MEPEWGQQELLKDAKSFMTNQSFTGEVTYKRNLGTEYNNLREEFKSKYNTLEVYLHTSEIRGRENYFAENYEPPEVNFLDMDTTNKSEEESLDEILNVYW